MKTYRIHLVELLRAGIKASSVCIGSLEIEACDATAAVGIAQRKARSAGFEYIDVNCIELVTGGLNDAD